MRSRGAQLILAAVCLLFGALLMVQFRTQTSIAKSVQTESSADQAQIVANLYEANVALRGEVATLSRQLQQLRDEAGAVRGADELAEDLAKLRVVNGTHRAEGPGVGLWVDADVRVEDVQDLINELRNAGAEAVSLNGDRITARTAVTSDRGQVVLNGRRVVAPYRFDAIGSPETLERALSRKGGLVSYLQNTYPEGTISVTKSDRLAIAAAELPTAFQLAQRLPAGAP